MHAMRCMHNVPATINLLTGTLRVALPWGPSKLNYKLNKKWRESQLASKTDLRLCLLTYIAGILANMQARYRP